MSAGEHEATPWLRMSITPEPSPEERDALIAAISAYLAAQAPVVETIERPPVSHWGVAGRRAAVRGRDGGSRLGWGRNRPGW